MTQLAIAGEAGFSLSLIDAPRPGTAPNFTLDTLLSLRAELPPEGQLFCLIGADSFLSLRRWHRATEIPFAGSLVVASRAGQPLDDLIRALPVGLTMEPAADLPSARAAQARIALDMRTYRLRNPAGEAAPLCLLPGLHVDISASQIRSQIRKQTTSEPEFFLSQPPLLPAAVLDYIRAHGLYR
jgi:nicotinate-nucleotide adenylyltransferase